MLFLEMPHIYKKRPSENVGYIFRLFLNLKILEGVPGKEGGD